MLDINSSPIKEFLLSKLQNAKDCTISLQDSFEIRRTILDKLQLKVNSGGVKVERMSKRVLHGNYIIKVDILNETNSDYYNPQCLLHWNSSEELKYTTACYVKDEVDATKRFDSNSLTTMIIVIHKAIFNNKSSYTVNGVITYKMLSESERELQTILPSSTWTVHDFTNKLDLEPSDIICGTPHGVLGILTLYHCNTFVIYTKNSDLTDTEEIMMTVSLMASRLTLDCMLRALNSGECSKGANIKYSFYYADAIAEAIDGALVKMHVPQEINGSRAIIVQIYTRSENHLFNFLHYLQKTLRDFQIHCIENYIRSNGDFSRYMKLQNYKESKNDLTKMLLKEIYSHRLIDCIEDNDVKFRKQIDLFRLEYETDKIADEILP